jgi:hypothetical protein
MSVMQIQIEWICALKCIGNINGYKSLDWEGRSKDGDRFCTNDVTQFEIYITYGICILSWIFFYKEYIVYIFLATLIGWVLILDDFR